MAESLFYQYRYLRNKWPYDSVGIKALLKKWPWNFKLPFLFCCKVHHNLGGESNSLSEITEWFFHSILQWYNYKIKYSFIPFNIGIVPVFCEQIFVGIEEKKQSGDTGQYEVTKGSEKYIPIHQLDSN